MSLKSMARLESALDLFRFRELILKLHRDKSNRKRNWNMKFKPPCLEFVLPPWLPVFSVYIRLALVKCFLLERFSGQWSGKIALCFLIRPLCFFFFFWRGLKFWSPSLILLSFQVRQCNMEDCSNGILCGSISPVSKLMWVQTSIV